MSADDELLGRVVMYGYAYEYRNRLTGEIHYLDPKEVTVVLPKSQADEYPHTWEARALKAEARIAELESQRDAVLAACDRVERDEPSAVFSQGGPVWAIWTADIRAAYEEDDDA